MNTSIITNLLKEEHNKKLVKSLKNIKKYDPNAYRNSLNFLAINTEKTPANIIFDIQEKIIFNIEKKLHDKTYKLTTLLIEAIQYRNTLLANEYLDKLHYYELCDEFGTTPLWVASCCGNVEILEKLVARGANVNPQEYIKTKNPFMVDSPLRTSMYKRKFYNYKKDKEEVFNYNRIIEILVQNGANVDSDMEKFLIFT